LVKSKTLKSSQVSEEASELVVNKAIDLWQQHSNSINIGLEFSIKHNPTALWAAQQVHSMPNLNSGPIIGGATNSGTAVRNKSAAPLS
jgi:hypothetical protein